jgi:hypothetical protein
MDPIIQVLQQLVAGRDRSRGGLEVALRNDELCQLLGHIIRWTTPALPQAGTDPREHEERDRSLWLFLLEA